MEYFTTTKFHNSRMAFLVLLLTTTVLSPVVLAANKSCEFIFNFGDSNSDTGGLSAAFFRLPPPYGITFPGYPTGRFSDGLLILDYMATSFGLPFIHPYLKSLSANFTYGANFATAGSTIGITITNDIPKGVFSPFILSFEYNQFEMFKSEVLEIRRQGGVNASLVPREEAFSEALYTIDIGQNDLTDRALASLTSVAPVYAAVPGLIAQFVTYVEKIYALGARFFWIHNTGPLGCLPVVQLLFPFSPRDSNGCARQYNEVSQFFNKKLKEAVFGLREVHPDASFIYVDIYSVKYSLFRDPLRYGFQNPLVPCCGSGAQFNNFSSYGGCGTTIDVNGTQTFQGSCDDRPLRVIWDGIHYTDAANRFVFKQISTGNFSDPPIPLSAACDRSALL